MAVIPILMAYLLDPLIGLPGIPISDFSSTALLYSATLLMFLMFALSFIALPPEKRERELVTSGIYRYVRHPIYAAFLYFFLMGPGFCLKSYSLIIAALFSFLICGKIVEREEKRMKMFFGRRYENYRKGTKKFIPFLY